MYVIAVTVHVKEPFVGDFIEAILDNATNTRQEPGNLRFDVLQCKDDPTRFLLYEAYRTEDDLAKHQQTEHYLRWKEAVTDWMAERRQSVKYDSLFFGDAEV